MDAVEEKVLSPRIGEKLNQIYHTKLIYTIYTIGKATSSGRLRFSYRIGGQKIQNLLIIIILLTLLPSITANKAKNVNAKSTIQANLTR